MEPQARFVPTVTWSLQRMLLLLVFPITSITLMSGLFVGAGQSVANRWPGLSRSQLISLTEVLPESARFAPSIEPDFITVSAPKDFDDPYIWIHPTDPIRSLVLGTDKKANQIWVFDLRGKTLQVLNVASNPNNIDGRDNYVFANLRAAGRLFVGRINPAYDKTHPPLEMLADANTNDQNQIQPDSYGLAVGKIDGVYYVFESPRAQPRLRQYQVDIIGDSVTAVPVRDFAFQENEIEGLVVDEYHNRLLAVEEEGHGLVFAASPSASTAPIEQFATESPRPQKDLEGLAYYNTGNGEGYLLLSSQGSHEVFVYDRVTLKLLDIINFNTHITDGLDVTSQSIPGLYDCGFAVLQNDPDKTFFNFYDWCDVVNQQPVPTG